MIVNVQVLAVSVVAYNRPSVQVMYQLFGCAYGAQL
jgi:hypothetical protein